jgi:hypothetical protein
MSSGLGVGIGVGLAVGSQLNLGNNLSAKGLLEKAGDKIQDVSDAAQNTISSKVNKIKSAFTGKDFSKKASQNVQPEAKKVKEQKIQLLQPLKSLSYYPAAMKYFMKFTIIDKSSESILSPIVEKEEVHIYLPIPNNMVDAYNVGYEDVQFGTVLGGSRELVNTIRQNNTSSTAGGFLNSVVDALTKESTSLANTAIAVSGAAGLAGLGQIGAIGAAARDALRVAPNPYLATVFNNVKLRQHQFSYRFAPKSESELAKLKEITLAFRRASLPSLGAPFDGKAGLLLKFPKEFKLEFYPTPNKPYFFERCVLESISLNYTPNGSPAFFKTGDPVSVEMTLNFQEIRAITADNIDAAEKELANMEKPETISVSEGRRLGAVVQTGSPLSSV